MSINTGSVKFSTFARTDVIDITAEVVSFVESCGIGTGTVNVFVPGSTGALTTIEFEPGLVKDMQKALERLFPEGLDYRHDERWRDGNGHSHIRASFLGPSLTIPIRKGKPFLGTWQQVIFLEMDNKPRERELLLTATGE